jgi:hypothetical protein
MTKKARFNVPLIVLSRVFEFGGSDPPCAGPAIPNNPASMIKICDQPASQDHFYLKEYNEELILRYHLGVPAEKGVGGFQVSGKPQA